MTKHEGKLSYPECYDAQLKFQNGKAPANDGLTVDFFTVFWNLFCQRLTDSLKFSFEHIEFPTDRNNLFMIRLIDEKGKDCLQSPCRVC